MKEIVNAKVGNGCALLRRPLLEGTQARGCGISWDLNSMYLGQSSHRAAFIHTSRDL